MKTQPSAANDLTFPAQAKLDAFRQHALFRLTVFALSAGAGYFFCRLVFTGLRLLPSLGAQAQASPVADVLHTLHAGFGN
jgi:hypothetical protein